MSGASNMLLLELSEFVVERVACFLPAVAVATLSCTCKDIRTQLCSSECVNWLARTRESFLFLPACRIFDLKTLDVASIDPHRLHVLVLFEFGCLDIANEHAIAPGLHDIARLLRRHPR